MRIWGSYFNIPKVIFRLLKGDYISKDPLCAIGVSLSASFTLKTLAMKVSLLLVACRCPELIMHMIQIKRPTPHQTQEKQLSLEALTGHLATPVPGLFLANGKMVPSSQFFNPFLMHYSRNYRNFRGRRTFDTFHIGCTQAVLNIVHMRR